MRENADGTGSHPWKSGCKAKPESGGCDWAQLASGLPSEKTKGCKIQDRTTHHAAGRLQRLMSTRFHRHFSKASCATPADTEAQKRLWPKEEEKIFNHFSNTDHSACDSAGDGTAPPCRSDPQPDTKGHHVTCPHQLRSLRQLVKQRYADRLDILVITGVGAVTTSVVESYNAVSANCNPLACGLRELRLTPPPSLPCFAADRPVVVHEELDIQRNGISFPIQACRPQVQCRVLMQQQICAVGLLFYAGTSTLGFYQLA